ncbi:pectate lyase [Aurantiacibacter spongiae]|uniref:Pectate lyase n=1 Tax=Aurantiacibacter spongiae TaxID=2488860 RepID=A0A3N5CYG6_9SPHN|nr:pectate lyase [Aurantiacibacter spongiae]
MFAVAAGLALAATNAPGSCSGSGSNSASAPIEQPGPSQPVVQTNSAAFPGATGYGAASRGGRDGRIMWVTTTADNTSGSLRECLEARGARVCIFRTGGIFRFVGRPPVIHDPYLTIAGESAPAPGVTLAHSGGSEARTPLVVKGTHDVVVRHIRVRNDIEGEHRQSEDSFTIEDSDNVILDHVSGSWARDELVNGYGDNDRITISNSIFAEGIPRHDKCALLASDPTGAQRLSFIGNLCAHNGDRNPDVNFPPMSCVEIINNTFYNAQSAFAEIWSSFGGSPVSLVGNSFIAGPNTGHNAIGIMQHELNATGEAQIYEWDNAFDGRFVHIGPEVAAVRVAEPPCPLTVNPLSPADAYRRVLASSGALPRDAVDERIVTEVRNRSGSIVQAPGSIPARFLAGSTEPAYPDIDRDGMDDGWEEANGIDRYEPDAWEDADRDGIANLEEFLAYRHTQLMNAAR